MTQTATTNLVTGLYQGFLGRSPDASGLTYWSNQIESSTASVQTVISSFFNSAEFQLSVGPVARLYSAAFNRVPDSAGLNDWVNQYRTSGNSNINTIAQKFVQSAEFSASPLWSNTQDNSAFVAKLYTNILGRTGSTAEINSWVTQLNNGTTRGAVLEGFSESAENQAKSAASIKVSLMYQALLNRPATAAEITAGSALNVNDLATLVLDSSTLPVVYTLTSSANTTQEGSAVTYTVTPSHKTASAATLIYTAAGDTLNGAATAAVNADFQLSTGNVTIPANSNTPVTFTITPIIDGLSEGLEGAKVTLLSSGNEIIGSKTLSITDGANVGQTYTLTANIDTISGTSVDDTINGTNSGLTSLDNIDGGAGNDTLNISDGSNPISVLSSVTVKNVETANLVSTGSVKGDLSGWTGLTKLVVSESGGTNGGITAPSTATVSVTDAAQGVATISIDGGTTVNVTSTGAGAGGSINVGTKTSPTGDVTISRTTTGAISASGIIVKGGTTVNITQAATNAVNTTQTNGVVNVTGTDKTTSVTVTAAAAATASATVAGVTANSVTITDVNGGVDKAGTITSATVSNFTTLGITDNALTTLSVTGGSGNIIIDNSGLTTPTNKTLNVTANALTGGVLDDADIYTTLNVTTTGKDSTLANITFGATTALNVAGSKVLTLTSTAGLTALKTVNVTGSAGVKADLSGATVTAVDTSGTTGTSTVTIDGSKATFTGGAGVDKVTTAATTVSKAISLGGGDDSLVLGGATAPTAAISGGSGTDTITMSAALAATASASSAFAGLVTGFESLVLTGATNQTIDLAVLGNFNAVSTSGGNGLTLSNLPTGGTLTLTGAGTAYTIGNSAFTAGTNDTVNLALTDGSGAGVAFASTGITASGVENFVITTADTQATPSGTFNDSVTLLGNSAKSITVSGNAGLTLTAASTAATLVDASGITGTTTGGFSWTSGALAAAATIKGSAAGTNTIDFSAATGGAVTYTGGSGNDTITGTNGKGNTVSLGDGTNSFTGSTGNHTITGGTGADTVTVGAGNNTVSLGNGTNAFTATTGNNTYTGGTGVDTVTAGGGLNTISTGTGADVITITTPGANVNVYSTITDAHTGDVISFADKGTEVFNSAKVTLSNTAVFQDYANAVIQAGGNSSVNGHSGWFQFAGDTYLVQSQHDGSGVNASFVNGTDFVIKLTGLVDLSTATQGGTNALTLA